MSITSLVCQSRLSQLHHSNITILKWKHWKQNRKEQRVLGAFSAISEITSWRWGTECNWSLLYNVNIISWTAELPSSQGTQFYFNTLLLITHVICISTNSQALNHFLKYLGLAFQCAWYAPLNLVLTLFNLVAQIIKFYICPWQSHLLVSFWIKLE